MRNSTSATTAKTVSYRSFLSRFKSGSSALRPQGTSEVIPALRKPSGTDVFLEQRYRLLSLSDDSV